MSRNAGNSGARASVRFAPAPANVSGVDEAARSAARSSSERRAALASDYAKWPIVNDGRTTRASLPSQRSSGGVGWPRKSSGLAAYE